MTLLNMIKMSLIQTIWVFFPGCNSNGWAGAPYRARGATASSTRPRSRASDWLDFSGSSNGFSGTGSLFFAWNLFFSDQISVLSQVYYFFLDLFYLFFFSGQLVIRKGVIRVRRSSGNVRVGCPLVNWNIVYIILILSGIIIRCKDIDNFRYSKLKGFDWIVSWKCLEESHGRV